MAAMTGVKSSKLMAWYAKHGILSSRLCIRTPESGLRGVFAEKDIPGLEGIAMIPPHMIIRSPFKDLEDIVQVNAAESNLNEKYRSLIRSSFRNVGTISINQPKRG